MNEQNMKAGVTLLGDLVLGYILLMFLLLISLHTLFKNTVS